MKVKIELKGTQPLKYTIADLDEAEGFTQKDGSLRIKINQNQYIRLDPEGVIKELSSFSCCPLVKDSAVRKFEIIVREI